MRDPTITEPRPLAAGLLYLASTLLFFAREKVGKTSLIVWLMKKLALGEEIFGQRSAPQTVLYASLEEGVHLVKMRMKQMKVPAKAPIHILSSVRHSNKTPLEVLTDAVVATKATVVVIDSLSAYAVGSKMGNSSDAWNDALYPLSQLASSLKFSLVIIHHANKTKGGEEFRGNSAIGAAVDTIASMTIPKSGDPNTRRIRYGGRYEGGVMHVTRDPDTGDYDLVDGEAVSQEIGRGQVTDDILAQRILDARRVEGGATMDTLRRAGGVKGTRTDAMVKKLLFEGRLVQRRVRGGFRYSAAA